MYGFYQLANGVIVNSGIKVYDLAANTEQIIAQRTDLKLFGETAVDGDKIVYEIDNNLYLYDLAVGQEKLLGNTSYRPSISGDDVVWEHHPDHAIYHHKISTNTTRIISPSGQQRVYPEVSNGIVVYQAYYGSNGMWDVFTYNLATNIETKVTTKSEGSGGSEIFSISGKNIVFQEGYGTSAVNYVYNLDTNIKTAITNVSAKKSTPWISGNRAVWTDSRYQNQMQVSPNDVLSVDISQISSSLPSSSYLAAIVESLLRILKTLEELKK